MNTEGPRKPRLDGPLPSGCSGSVDASLMALVDELSDRVLRGEDVDLTRHLGTVDGHAIDERHLAQIGVVEAAPDRRDEDADRHRDGQGESAHHQLLRSQLILPPRAMLAIEGLPGFILVRRQCVRGTPAHGAQGALRRRLGVAAGGLLQNLPLEATFEMGARHVIGVRLAPEWDSLPQFRTSSQVHEFEVRDDVTVVTPNLEHRSQWVARDIPGLIQLGRAAAEAALVDYPIVRSRDDAEAAFPATPQVPTPPAAPETPRPRLGVAEFFRRH